MRPEPPTDPNAEARRLEDQCPGLPGTEYEIASASTPTYNCVAYALGDYSRVWSPAPVGGYYWPPEIPAWFSVQAVRRLFEQYGYVECEPETMPELDQVAIFGDEIECRHVAVRRAGGGWESKMGDAADFRHELAAIEGGLLGRCVLMMCRSDI